MRPSCLIALVVALAACVPRGPFPVVRREGDAPVYELRNGRWFDGARFVEGTRWTVYGVVTERPPATVDSVIDLAGRWVVPAYGEAHNHNAVPADTAAIRRHLAAGIFYVKNPNALPRDRARADTAFGHPRTIDAVLANGGITGPGGHPVGLVRRNVARGVWTEREGEGAFLHTVRTVADVDRMWSAFLAARPQLVKTYLLYSEEYTKRLADSATVGWRGMEPALLPHVVRKAHDAKLRVTTHVETAADFRAAVEAGVDEIAHLPGFRPEGETLAAWWPLERFRLREPDAREAARRGVVVVTTVSEALELLDGGIASSGAAADSARAVRSLIVENLRLLHAAGVRLAVGSDRYRATSREEAMALARTGVFTNVELLRMWSMTTPRTIFPARRVGSLETGAEASFLVLEGDPIAELANANRITLRVKQGWIVR